jgi:hypothetical protein
MICGQDCLTILDCFSPSGVATSLFSLGMDPSFFSSKQVFEFLLGQVWGLRVPRLLQTIEESLLDHRKPKSGEFDRTAHNWAVTAGKNSLVTYFQQTYILDTSRFQPGFDYWGRQTPQKLTKK